ncbi:MAG TPA: hypothetical protein PLZ61_06230, partial [Candidatus Cryosericum sp.]|nr:hypothetical protein [Candidatus Cryosericum sp.]
FGFRYIWQHRPLFNLQMVFFAFNLVASLCMVITPALILARTGNNAAALATTQSAAAVGGLVGGAVVTAWGGPRRKVHGVLMGMIGSSLLGTVVLGLGRVLPVWVVASFLAAGCDTLLNASNQAIWQAKVSPALQGRVFSVRRLIAQVSAPLAMLASGPLADRVFGPAMMPGGSLASVFGWLTGTGAGAGMVLMFVGVGLASAAVGLAGYLIPSVRDVERITPDYDTSPEATSS